MWWRLVFAIMLFLSIFLSSSFHVVPLVVLPFVWILVFEPLCWTCFLGLHVVHSSPNFCVALSFQMFRQLLIVLLHATLGLHDICGLVLVAFKLSQPLSLHVTLHVLLTFVLFLPSCFHVDFILLTFMLLLIFKSLCCSWCFTLHVIPSTFDFMLILSFLVTHWAFILFFVLLTFMLLLVIMRCSYVVSFHYVLTFPTIHFIM